MAKSGENRLSDQDSVKPGSELSWPWHRSATTLAGERAKTAPLPWRWTLPTADIRWRGSMPHSVAPAPARNERAGHQRQATHKYGDYKLRRSHTRALDHQQKWT